MTQIITQYTQWKPGIIAAGKFPPGVREYQRLAFNKEAIYREAGPHSSSTPGGEFPAAVFLIDVRRFVLIIRTMFKRTKFLVGAGRSFVPSSSRYEKAKREGRFFKITTVVTRAPPICLGLRCRLNSIRAHRRSLAGPLGVADATLHTTCVPTRCQVAPPFKEPCSARCASQANSNRGAGFIVGFDDVLAIPV
jgi:hypothetical protein